MPFYQTTFHGIDLIKVCEKIDHPLDEIAGPEVYSSAYSALKERNFFDIDEVFIRRKKMLSKWVIDVIQQYNVSKILSVGAGTAILENFLRLSGYDLHLQECQLESLDYLKKSNKNWDSGIKEFSIIDQNLEDIEPNSFDCVVSFSSSYFFDDSLLVKLFLSVRNILRKGGIFILYDNSFNVHDFFLNIYWTLRRTKHSGVKWGYKRTLSDWNKIAQKCGFENKSESFFDIENELSSTNSFFGMPVEKSVVWQAVVYKVS